MGVLLVQLAWLAPAIAEPPEAPPERFAKAKQLARDQVYGDRPITFYCGCYYSPRGTSGGVIDFSDCGFSARKNTKRAARLEWEHVVPASRIARHRRCWAKGHGKCSRKGRRCCEKKGVDDWARLAINDLHNLVPSVGEINGDRSNHPYGIVEGEGRLYGACDFELGGSPKRAEPHDHIHGNAARVWLYVNETYLEPEGKGLSSSEVQLFEEWSEADPVGDWELERDARIEEIQGNSNPFVADE